MHNTWSYDDILALGSLRRPRNEEVKILKKSRQSRLWAQGLGTRCVPKTERYGGSTQLSDKLLGKDHFYSTGIRAYFNILVLGTLCVPRVYLKLVKLWLSVPKSGGTTHGYGLGTLCVPNNKQGNYPSNLLGSNLCELKRLRRSSLTFFLEDFHHDAIHLLSSTTLYSIATIVDNKLL